VRLVLGGPGCGKTTRLLDLLEEELKTCRPDEIGFLAFTRKAAEEARERVRERFNLGHDDLPYFRTIHSLAFRQLGLVKDEVMTGADYVELGQALGVKIGMPDPDLGVPLGGELGDRMVFLEQLSRVTETTLEAQARQLNLWHLRRYRSALESFKRSRHVIDFTDMITRFTTQGPMPRFKALFVDEAQDLTPIHWTVIDELSRLADRTYIGGDDDQAIYKWAGADVNKFLTLPATGREVLPVSYRLNRQVWGLSDAIARRIKHRYPKQWTSREEDGPIRKFDRIDDLNMRDAGTWLVLARHNYMLEPAVQALRRNGVPYVFKGSSSTDNATVRAIVAWEQLRAGKKITAKRATRMLEHVRQTVLVKRIGAEIDSDMPIGLGDLGFTEPPPDWMISIKMTDPEREYYRSILRHGESLTKPPRVRVSTIHGSKGGQADSTILIRDMSDICHLDYVRKPDDECRVFYVGASRCRNALYLQHPKSSRFFHLPV
jgi:superfamily I DNA/RNA helicase